MRTRILFVVYYCIISTAFHGVHANESAVLLDIYRDTGGENWYTKWNVSNILNDPCNGSLFGIECVSNHVSAIKLSSNNLTGRLPKSIANLTSLSVLNMSNNALKGSIPFETFSLANVQMIDLSGNYLNGSLILGIDSLDPLTQLHLNNNKLSGSIPNNLGTLLPNLRELSLHHNAFSSTIPSPLFGNLRELRSLSLHHNELSESIPHTLNASVSLEYAYFHDNNLNGMIPLLPLSIIGVTFHNNDLAFDDDDGLSHFLMGLNHKPHLQAITIYNNNNLYGELVPFNTSTLKIFMSHSCQIASTLPSSIHFVPSHISLINNRLSSLIPDDFITPYNKSSDPLQIALFGQGNKFKFDIGSGVKVNNPLWIHKSVLNTNSGQLFYTEQLRLLEIFIISIVFGIVLFLIIYNIHRLHKEKLKREDPAAYKELKKNDPLYAIVHSQPYSFFSQLKDIARYLYFAPALLFAVLTAISYFTSSNKYYSNADFLLNWSIIYIGAETDTLWDTISQWIASVYSVVYVGFTLYLYYIFYYRFTFPMLFYRKIQETKRVMRAVPSSSPPISPPEQDKYVYTLSGKGKKQSKRDEYYQFDQETRLFTQSNEIFIPKKTSSFDVLYDDDDDDLSISLNEHSFDGKTHLKESLLNKSGDMNGWSDIEIENLSRDRVDMANHRHDRHSTVYGASSNSSNKYCCVRNKRKIKRSCKSVFWLCMFLMCEFVIVFYFATISIPNHNVFDVDFNGGMYSILRYSVWLVIAVCNSFIIPRISKQIVKKVFWICCEWNRQEKMYAITITSSIIRSFNLVWIPVLLLFFMHNDCARYCNYYWSKCRDDGYANQFEFCIGKELIDIKSSICSYGLFCDDYQINYGKCFRSVLEEWAIIIIFSSFGYIVCMLMFWLYSVSRYYYKLRRQYTAGIRKLGSIINVEYAEIWNHVQIVVIFGCALPFVIPMIAFLLLVNKWVYSSLLSYKFRLSDVNPYFPAQLLIITNAAQQMIIILFMWHNRIKGRYFVTLADSIIDCAFAIWWFWYRNKKQNSNSNQHSFIFLVLSN
eukprot:224078_1